MNCFLQSKWVCLHQVYEQPAWKEDGAKDEKGFEQVFANCVYTVCTISFPGYGCTHAISGARQFAAQVKVRGISGFLFLSRAMDFHGLILARPDEPGSDGRRTLVPQTVMQRLIRDKQANRIRCKPVNKLLQGGW